MYKNGRPRCISKRRRRFVSSSLDDVSPLALFPQVKFESDPCKSYDNLNQDTLIRHLQSRISDLREDNMRLRKIEH